ncbi:hypothetical protein SXCC_02338 [Gluconacetobacter sp. SXCC-1]|nr:hypothetical protein SXCC_02338 [Gluconacetobacter sp. SXCC-1]
MKGSRSLSKKSFTSPPFMITGRFPVGLSDSLQAIFPFIPAS